MIRHDADTSSRLDQSLVARGLAASRTKAQELIRAGHVSVDGLVVTRPSTLISAVQDITVAVDQWVSRAAFKLIGALDASGFPVRGRIVDAGASTGGFTEVLLARGASQVYAIDVGHDQLAAKLRSDPRVVVKEGLNLRELTLADVDEVPTDALVCDVSFISLRLLLAPMLAVVRPDGDVLLMIKPQFEVGKHHLQAGGVVRDEALRQGAIDAVIADANALGWTVHWRADSGLRGKDGNLEHFVWLKKSDKSSTAA